MILIWILFAVKDIVGITGQIWAAFFRTSQIVTICVRFLSLVLREQKKETPNKAFLLLFWFNMWKLCSLNNLNERGVFLFNYVDLQSVNCCKVNTHFNSWYLRFYGNFFKSFWLGLGFVFLKKQKQLLSFLFLNTKVRDSDFEKNTFLHKTRTESYKNKVTG